MCKHPCAGHIGPYGQSCTMLMSEGLDEGSDENSLPDDPSDATFQGREGETDRVQRFKQLLEDRLLQHKEQSSIMEPAPAGFIEPGATGNAGEDGVTPGASPENDGDIVDLSLLQPLSQPPNGGGIIKQSIMQQPSNKPEQGNPFNISIPTAGTKVGEGAISKGPPMKSSDSILTAGPQFGTYNNRLPRPRVTGNVLQADDEVNKGAVLVEMANQMARISARVEQLAAERKAPYSSAAPPAGGLSLIHI